MSTLFFMEKARKLLWISSGYLIDYIPADYLVQNKDKIADKKLFELVNILNEESNPVLVLYEDKS